MSRIAVAREAMRTRFEIVLRDASRSEADLRAAGEEALEEILRWEKLLSVYRPDADLRRVNARAAAHPVAIDARLMAFLVRCRDLSVQTGGAFDPTVGPLLRVWDIGGDAGARRPAPDAVQIDAARRLVGMADGVLLDVENGTVAFREPGVRLDPGAIGKGYALEQAAALLREGGITDALLHGGTSSVVGIGSDENRRGWRIAVRHPTGGGTYAAFLDLRDAALSVSASADGHIVDPATGQCVTGPRLAAAVAASATDAETLSTALLVCGAEGIAPLAENFPDARLLFVSANEYLTVGEGWERD